VPFQLCGGHALGFIPRFGGISLTIMHVPVIIGAVLEEPVVGLDACILAR